MRFATTVGVAAVLLALTGAPARAVGGDHTHEPVVVGVTPSMAGITVEVRAEPAPTLVLHNRSGESVDVLDDDGVPFVRIGPDRIEANVASPTFYRSEAPSIEATVPPSATGGEPRFATLVDGSEWAWFEHRITATPIDAAWSIPIRVGDRDAAIHGRWQPVFVPGRVESTIDPSVIDTVTVELLPGNAPGIFVANDADETLEIPDANGQPFLRIGPTDTQRAVPGGGWEVVAPTPRYGWIDPRIGFQGESPTERVTREWAIPARLGPFAFKITGSVRWIPLAPPPEPTSGPVDTGFPLVPVLVVVAAPTAVGLFLARKDKRT